MCQFSGVKMRTFTHPTFMGGETHIHVIVPFPLDFEDKEERHRINSCWINFQRIPSNYVEVNEIIDKIRAIAGKINSIIIGKNAKDGTYLDLIMIKRINDTNTDYTISELEKLVPTPVEKNMVDYLF